MKITIKYYGKLTDLTGTEEEEIDILNNGFVSDIENVLFQKYLPLKTEQFAWFRNNSIILQKTVPVEDNDEICLMPPFSGG
jgi:molybdopterin converting factor small subunit